MKLGYACTNTALSCSASKIFRLKSYSSTKLIETITNNLTCLEKILKYNVKHGLLFFRISSNTIPFASHDICQFNWLEYFHKQFQSIGNFIQQHNMRISMHPGQFVVLNSPKESVIRNSIKELTWHCYFLDALGLDKTAKLQIHVGGVYNDKEGAIEQFVHNYEVLPDYIKERVVIENDEHSYSIQDCLKISQITNVPVILDTLHHECLNNSKPISDALDLAQTTWSAKDGVLMVDYSSQNPHGKKGEHAKSLKNQHFKSFIENCRNVNFDVMLEVKDKEKSALKALKLLQNFEEHRAK